MTNRAPFARGTLVRKFKGYSFPGVVETCYVVSAGPDAGKWRVVVTCTAPEVAGCQHIFAPEQLMLTDSVVSAPVPKRT